MTFYIWLCVAILAVLFYGDYWTTRNALKRAGNHEANPIMAKLFGLIGVEHGLIMVKGGSLALIAWLAYIGAYESRMGMIALILVTLAYAAVVANNLRIYRGG